MSSIYDLLGIYPLGQTFEARAGNWKGARVALFSYNETADAGTAWFNWFRYQYDGPKGVATD